MHDNKLRLSPDIITKAEEIAETWGLKNSRAAVEAVFRKYADDYQYGRQPMMAMLQGMQIGDASGGGLSPMPMAVGPVHSGHGHNAPAESLGCAALSELDDLLGI
jgi:hypothetical protein